MVRQLMWESSFKYDSVWDELRDIWKHLKRQLNKRRGLPATPDVGVLGNLIKQLRSASEENLRRSISAAVAARPHLPGLTPEDLNDAMEYAGLRNLRAYNYFGDVSETSAAFAGMGQGLCEHYADINTCEEEDSNLPLQYILALSFTRVSLSLSLSSLRDAHANYESKAIIAWDLGLSALDQTPDPAAYWDLVRSAIRDIALKSPQPITTLLLLGEESTNATFLDVVRDALRDLLGFDLLRVGILSSPEPLYVAAKGAAEFAKRFQETPWNCKEPERCRENRRTQGFVLEMQAEL
ncbi:MAG: hypothetical protein M1813_008345 [Trichoglossum hirsutum]|nr:MAG: hypothetical protein M1813_008345 [Trichoglossum hirsutum]